MNYVYEGGFCVGYVRGDTLVRFITPIRAELL